MLFRKNTESIPVRRVRVLKKKKDNEGKDRLHQVLKKRVVKIPIKKNNATIQFKVNETSNELQNEAPLNVVGLNLTHHALDHLQHDLDNSSRGNETESSDNIEEPTRKVVVKKVKRVKAGKSIALNETQVMDNQNETSTNEASNQNENPQPKTKKRLVKKIKLSPRRNSTNPGDEIRRINDEIKDWTTNPLKDKTEALKKAIGQTISNRKKTKVFDGNSTDSRKPVKKTDLPKSETSEGEKIPVFDSPILNLENILKQQFIKKKIENEQKLSEDNDETEKNPKKNLHLALLQSLGQLKKRNKMKLDPTHKLWGSRQRPNVEDSLPDSNSWNGVKIDDFKQSNLDNSLGNKRKLLNQLL